jgi:hypothetical protein
MITWHWHHLALAEPVHAAQQLEEFDLAGRRERRFRLVEEELARMSTPVMLALVASIHVLSAAHDRRRRGWSGQARP